MPTSSLGVSSTRSQYKLLDFVSGFGGRELICNKMLFCLTSHCSFTNPLPENYRRYFYEGKILVFLGSMAKAPFKKHASLTLFSILEYVFVYTPINILIDFILNIKLNFT